MSDAQTPAGVPTPAGQTREAPAENTGKGPAGASRRRPRDVGTDAERAVVRVLRDHGFPHAERRALRGSRDAGDITGTPGVLWEVKGGNAARDASDRQVREWFGRLNWKAGMEGAGDAVLVLQRRGIGPANAGDWWAVTTVGQLIYVITGTHHDPGCLVRLQLADMCERLVAAGYGEVP